MSPEDLIVIRARYVAPALLRHAKPFEEAECALPKRAHISKIITAVEAETGIPRRHLFSYRRRAEIVRARWALTAAIAELTDYSLPQIAKIVNRDRTYIPYAVVSADSELVRRICEAVDG